MTLRDMTPDELELFEEEIVQGSAEQGPARESDREETAREPRQEGGRAGDRTAGLPVVQPAPD